MEVSVIKKKRIKIILIVSVILIILIAVSSFVSYIKFNVANPFSTASGLIQITFTEKEYVQIQQYPKVIIAKPGEGLLDYMNEKGFTENEDAQLGAMRVFANGDATQSIMYSTNKYFSKWFWVE